MLRTTADLTLNNAAWTDVSTSLDMTIAAQVGDDIEYGISGILSAGGGGTNHHFDVATIVSAAPVNYFSNGTVTPAAGGVSGWYAASASEALLSGSVMYTIVSGDLASGLVTLRLRHKQDAAGNRTLYSSASNPLFVWVKNLGPSDPT